jgi:hypothetical protein
MTIDEMKENLGAAGWNLNMDLAPRDGTPVVGYCVHLSDAFQSSETTLTPYSAHSEDLGHVPDGPHVIVWGGSYDDDMRGAIPDWWFRAGSDWEEPAAPIAWLPIPPLEQQPTYPGPVTLFMAPLPQIIAAAIGNTFATDGRRDWPAMAAVNAMRAVVRSGRLQMAAYEDAARIARDAGAPTEAESATAEEAARRIMARAKRLARDGWR